MCDPAEVTVSGLVRQAQERGGFADNAEQVSALGGEANQDFIDTAQASLVDAAPTTEHRIRRTRTRTATGRPSAGTSATVRS